jgi:putative thioredoxin
VPAIDVTDATFETEVLARSQTTPVLIDLWAEWCGPCKTLGPTLEKVVDATDGKVALVKVDVDANPGLAQAFRVQSIPAVFVAQQGKVYQGFIGAQPESVVQQLVDSLLPSQEDNELAALVEAGDEESLRKALEIDPGHESAVVGLAELLAGTGETESLEEASALLERIPETADTRRVAALIRIGPDAAAVVDDNVEAKLDSLLDRVKDDEDAREEFVAVLELLGPDDERTAAYRRKLTNRLF